MGERQRTDQRDAERPETPDDATQRRKERGAAPAGDGSRAAAEAAPRRDADDSTSFEVSHLEGGGGPSNTPPQKTTLGGEDTLVVNFYANHQNWPSTVACLNAAQLAAQEGRKGEDELQLGDVRAIVLPSGARRGQGDKAQHMRWRLKTEQGVTLSVQNRGESHKTQPNLSATVGSALLMRRGLSTVWAGVQYVVESLG